MTGTMSGKVSIAQFVGIGFQGPRTLDDQVGAEDTHGSDTDTRLGGTVRGAKAGEDNGAGAAHSTKEGLNDR
jgi:hypothetical protein